MHWKGEINKKKQQKTKHIAYCFSCVSILLMYRVRIRLDFRFYDRYYQSEVEYIYNLHGKWCLSVSGVFKFGIWLLVSRCMNLGHKISHIWVDTCMLYIHVLYISLAVYTWYIQRINVINGNPMHNSVFHYISEFFMSSPLKHRNNNKKNSHSVLYCCEHSKREFQHWDLVIIIFKWPEGTDNK